MARGRQQTIYIVRTQAGNLRMSATPMHFCFSQNLLERNQAGYTAYDLRTSCIKAREIVASGRGLWEEEELLEAGYSMCEVQESSSSSSSSASPQCNACDGNSLSSQSQPSSNSVFLDSTALKFHLKNM